MEGKQWGRRWRVRCGNEHREGGSVDAQVDHCVGCVAACSIVVIENDEPSSYH